MRICLLVLALNLYIIFEAKGNDYLQKVCSISKFNKYTFFSPSPSGDYILVSSPTDPMIKKTPKDSEFGPGGLFRLYSKKGILLWKKRNKGDLFFCSNESYLSQPSSLQFHSLEPSAIYYRKDGNLFFRLSNSNQEVLSFDVNPKGDMILVSLHNNTIFLMHKGKKVWTYEAGIFGLADVAFSNDGKFFMEGASEKLFSVDKYGVVHKIDVTITAEVLSSFDYKELDHSIHFLLATLGKIYTYNPTEKKLIFLDLSRVKEMRRNLVLGYLERDHIQPKEIMFSDYLDHVGVITDNTFYYFKIN